MSEERIQCACGCGESLLRYHPERGYERSYINGHNRRGTTFTLSPEAVEKSAKNRRGEKHHLYGKHLSEKTREKISKALKGEKCYLYGKTGPDHPKFKGRFETGGYVFVYAPDHPRASPLHVPEHTLVAERALGRHLREGEEVHHINFDGTDNRPENLLICTRSYHTWLHHTLRR